jgi:hypothetical protein
MDRVGEDDLRMPASLNSLTRRSWKVPHSLSTRPLAWGESAKIDSIPKALSAPPTWVGVCSPANSSSRVQWTSFRLKIPCRSM